MQADFGQTGIVLNKLNLENINPMEFIPTAVCLTAYAGGPDDFMQTPVKDLVQKVAEGAMTVPIGKVFKGLDNIVEVRLFLDIRRMNYANMRKGS